MQGCKRIHRHRFNEYIMVSNALGGVNGRSRAVIHRLDISTDQYRFLSNLTMHKEIEIEIVALVSNDLCSANQEIDNVSFQGHRSELP
jgi:hypothetical protein